MNLQRSRFLYFAAFVAIVLVVWFTINFAAVKTR